MNVHKRNLLFSFMIFLFFILSSAKVCIANYSFVFGVPDQVIIGSGETGIDLIGVIINNGDYPISINGGGAGPDPYHSSPSPWWQSNLFSFDNGGMANIQPGEIRYFRLGIFSDDSLIPRNYQYLWCFFEAADLDSDGNFDIGAPLPYADSNGWLFNEMAQSLISFGDTSYVSPNYYYIQSSLSPDFHPIPIPAAAWLLGSGLVGLVMIRRKLRK